MARPTKTGLDYYPMDVGFLRDKKVRLLRSEFGASSVLFVLYVLGKVYEGDAELLDALEYKARELFGSKANLTVRSPLGIFLRIFAWVLNLLFCSLQTLAQSAAAKLTGRDNDGTLSMVLGKREDGPLPR